MDRVEGKEKRDGFRTTGDTSLYKLNEGRVCPMISDLIMHVGELYVEVWHVFPPLRVF